MRLAVIAALFLSACTDAVRPDPKCEAELQHLDRATIRVREATDLALSAVARGAHSEEARIAHTALQEATAAQGRARNVLEVCRAR